MANMERKMLNCIKYETQGLAKMVENANDQIGCKDELLSCFDMAIEVINKALDCIEAKEEMGKVETRGGEKSAEELRERAEYKKGFMAVEIVEKEKDEVVEKLTKLNRLQFLNDEEKSEKDKLKSIIGKERQDAERDKRNER